MNDNLLEWIPFNKYCYDNNISLNEFCRVSSYKGESTRLVQIQYVSIEDKILAKLKFNI